MSHLRQHLRQHGVEDVKLVRKAYVESDGHISIIKASPIRAARHKSA